MLIRPGQKSPLLTLQSVLRERHESIAADVAADIARRTRDGGVVFDEGIRWPEVQAAVDVKDAIKVRALVADARRPLDPYEPIAGLDDVKVRFIALDAETRENLVEAVIASKGGTESMLALLRATVAELQVGGESLSFVSSDDVAAIKATGGLLLNLYVAARDYQGLPPGKGRRFGSPPPSTT